MPRHQYKAMAIGLVVLGLVVALAWTPTAEPADAHHTAWHKPKRTTTTTATPPTTEPPTTTTTVPATACRSPIVTTAAPITITTGGVYSGYYRSADPSVPAVTIQTSQLVELDHACIEHAGMGVFSTWTNAQLNIHDTTFQKLATPLGAASEQRAVYAYATIRLLFDYNLLIDGDGVRWTDFDSSGAVAGSFTHNEVRNVGRYQPTELVQAFSLTEGTTVPGMEVAWNKITNTFGQSDSEDVIHFNKSGGITGQRIQVHHNLVDGSYPLTTGVVGFTGTGLNIGDGFPDTANASSFIDAHHNWVIATSNIGIGVSGGTDHEVYDNVVISTGRINGVISGSDFGAGISDSFGVANVNKFIHNNTIGWNRPVDASTLQRFDKYFPSAASDFGVYDAADDAVHTGNVAMSDPIDDTDYQAARDAWNAARITAGETVGPRPFEPAAIAGKGYSLVFEEQFNTLGQTWTEFPWFPARNGNTVENGHLFVRTEPNNPFSVGNEATSLGPYSQSFPHYPAAKTWQGPWIYFEARFRYTNNPWTVPAFWLYTFGRANLWPDPDSWCPNTNPEWDIVENNIVDPGSDALGTQGLHKNTNSYCSVTDEVQVEWTPDHGSGLSGWHVWSGWWTDTALIQYLDDGVQSFMAHNGWLNTPLFMVLHIDEGSTTPPGNPAKASQYELEVDWVKVWKKT